MKKIVILGILFILAFFGCAPKNTYLVYEDGATIERTYPPGVKDELSAFFDSVRTPDEFAEYFEDGDNFRYDYKYRWLALHGKIPFKKGELPHRPPEYLWVTKRGVCTETANFASIWLSRNGYENKLLWFTNSYGRTHTVCVFKNKNNDSNWYILGDSRQPGEIQGPFQNFKEVEKRLFNQGAELKIINLPKYGY